MSQKLIEAKISVAGELDPSLKKSLDKSAKNFDDLKATLSETAKEFAELKGAVKEAEQTNKDLIKANDRLAKSNEDIARANEDLNKSLDEAAKEFDNVKKSVGSFADTAVKSFAAVGAAAAAALGATMVKVGGEYEAAMNDLATRTGASGEALKEFGDIAREVWKSGKGEDMNDVASALANIHQTSKLAGEELKTATNAAMTLKDAFGIEVEESTRAATAMMKNFGISAQEAYGLIAYGAQNGANRNGDLVDVLNEYSVQYKSLGLTADQFMQSLVTGAEKGVWQIDKVGDAIKEFNIRAKDGSKKSVEAFDAIGLNGKKITEAFAQGGDAAQKAFFQTVEALKKVDNEVQRNAVGVSLFGTMYEDLEKGLLDMASSMQGANIEAGKTLDLVADTKYSGLNASITEIGRSFQDALIPGAEKASQAIKDNMPAIKEAISELTPYLEKLGNYIGEKLPEAIDKAVTAFKDIVEWIKEHKDELILAAEATLYLYGTIKTIQAATAIYNGITKAVALYKSAQVAAAAAGKGLTVAQWALNAAMTANPIGLIIAGIAALIAAVWLCWKNWDKITAWMKETWQSFANAFPETAAYLQASWEQVCANFKLAWELVKNVFVTAWNYLKEVWAGICALFRGDWDGFCQHFNAAGQAIIDGFKNAWNLVKEWFGGTVERLKPYIDALKNAFTQAWEAIKTKIKAVFDSIMEYIKPIIDKVAAIGDTLNGLKDKAAGALEGIKQSKINPANWFAAGGFTDGISICGEAGTEAVISFDPRYRKENQGYLMTAAEMLGMTAAPVSTNTTSNSISLNFAPVIKSGGDNNAALVAQLRACMPELVDMIEEALSNRKGHRYA